MATVTNISQAPVDQSHGTYDSWEGVPQALREQLEVAQAESENKLTIVCHGKKELQHFLDSL